MLLKYKIVLLFPLVFIILLFMLNGCSTASDLSVDNGDVTAEDTDIQVDEQHHNLSIDGSLLVSEFITNDTNFALQQNLVTNSHEIAITNNSGAIVVIDLYSNTNADNSIRQMSLDCAETKSFTGLTSRFQYRIYVSTEESTQLILTITD